MDSGCPSGFRRVGALKNRKQKSARAPQPATVAAVPNTVKRVAFDRIVKIFGWLQDGRHPNCTSLAGILRFRSRRRDIDFMRDRWELPIGYDDKRHGFYLTKKVDRLPWVPVTEAELFAVTAQEIAQRVQQAQQQRTTSQATVVA